MYKEFFDIVGSGKPTGSAWKETIEVSATMSISVEKLHHQIRLRILSCGRVSENHREPEVPEESPSGRMSRWPCKDYLRGTCNNSFCEKWHPPECLFYKTESGCRFGEKCSFVHRQVDEQPTKRSKKNDDKNAVAMLKKGNWQERERERLCHQMNVTTDRGNLGREVIRRWDKIHINLNLLMQDNWVAYFRT